MITLKLDRLTGADKGFIFEKTDSRTEPFWIELKSAIRQNERYFMYNEKDLSAEQIKSIAGFAGLMRNSCSGAAAGLFAEIEAGIEDINETGEWN